MLRRAADLTALGGDPGAAWSVHGGADGGEDATCVGADALGARSATSGSALAQGISDLAEQVRHEVAQAANAAAGRASVLIAGPLGLCFLPAFVCVGWFRRDRAGIGSSLRDPYEKDPYEKDTPRKTPPRKTPPERHPEKDPGVFVSERKSIAQQSVTSLRDRLSLVLVDESGMSTVEYAVGTWLRQPSAPSCTAW